MEPVKREVELGLNNKENDTIFLAQSGNVKAFEHLVSTYESYIYNLAYRMFNNVLDAQDATQEIFIKIYRNLPKFKFKSKFKTWIYKIAVNTCIDELKKKKERIFERIDSEDSDFLDEFPDMSGKTPEEQLLDDEMKNEIRQIIKKLPMKYKLPVILRDFQGLTYDEISQVLNLKLDTVKVRINRGRLKIRAKLLKNMKQKQAPASLKHKELLKGGERK